jgi:hypothetical protein
MASRVGEGDMRAAQGRRDDYPGHSARLGLATEPLDRSRDPSEAESQSKLARVKAERRAIDLTEALQNADKLFRAAGVYEFYEVEDMTKWR